MHWTDLTNKTVLEEEFECSHMGLLCLDLNNTEPCPDFEVRYQCKGLVLQSLLLLFINTRNAFRLLGSFKRLFFQ